ncbi:MAG: hypothetical protein LJE95_10835 [Acidobacteria bacterium]|nr:hypothetical protein [Acidobacteriota bacterium]
MMIALVVVVVVLGALPSHARRPLRATQAPSSLDRDGDGRIGEADTIRQRYRLAIERLGGDRTPIQPQTMLGRAREVYRRHIARAGSAHALGVAQAGAVSLGPNNGAGRITAVAPNPTDLGTVLVGAAGGGVWKTTDTGVTWTPLTDGIPNLSVGALTYAPSDANIVYVGTGEGGYGIDFIPGIGLLRSDDGGETWSLPDTVVATQFYRINVDPRDPDTLLAATNAGLLRSDTGGATWTTPLAVSAAGGSHSAVPTDVVRSSDDPDHLYAALWCFSACPTGYGRVMASTDNGVTWHPAATGLPTPDSDWSLNRLALALAASNDQILYATFNEGEDEGSGPPVTIYKTTDGGSSWSKISTAPAYLGQQGWYDNTLTVNPTNPSWLVGGGVYYVVSVNGGATWTTRKPSSGSADLPHVDAHDLQWQGNSLWLGCDGGVWRSSDGGSHWIDCNVGLITRQYYALSLDPIHHDRILAGAQDNGTNRRSDTDDGSWTEVLGGDGFECAINPSVPDIQYATIYNTQVFRSLAGGRFVPAEPAFGSDEVTPFITPLTLDATNPSVVYTGTSKVWRSENGGDTWEPLPTEVTNGAWNPSEIWSIATTAADAQVLMVAKNRDLYRSEDGGSTWYATHFGDDGLPSRRVINIEISPFDADVALACLGSTTGPGIYRTTDGGLTWSAAADGLAQFSVQVARWDPADPSVVYAGTDVGLFRSTDGGLSWESYGDGLPAVSIHDIRSLADGSMLRVATHGRGVWGLLLPQSHNRAPVVAITSPSATLTIERGGTATFSATATDPDGDPLSVRWMVTDSWATNDGGSGNGTVSSTLRHTFDIGGSYYATASARDSSGAVGAASVKVVVDDPADSCATPRVLATDSWPQVIQLNNSAARGATSDPAIPCIHDDSDADAGRHATLWFELTPQESGRYSLTTCDGGSDTVLTAWTGAACGPYTAVASGCNDDDELRNCKTARIASHLELDLEAGTTYRFMIGAYSISSVGRYSLTADCLSCASSALDRVYTVPAAAHSDGLNGTHWMTDLNLYNPSQRAASVLAAFLPAGSDNGNAQEVTLTVPAASALDLRDVVKTTFASTGPGAVRFRASGPLLITSRTYNSTAAGTYGQFVRGALENTAIPPGESATLVGLEADSAFRSNIGISNTSDQPAAAEVDLYNASGDLLATHPVSLPAYGWVQETDIYGLEHLDDVSDGFAVVRNTSAAAAVLTYASVVDNSTGDPTFVTPVAAAAPETPVWIAAAAHTTGLKDSLWRSDLELVNTADANTTVTLDYLPADHDNTTPISRQLVLPAKGAQRIQDVLGSLFATTGAGAIRVSVGTGSVIVTSRTFNQAEKGTLGQFIPARAQGEGFGAGDAAVLTQLRRDTDFRTNIGIVNLTGDAIRVTAEYHRADGSTIATTEYDLLPYAFHQHTKAIPGNEDLEGGFAVLTSASPGARFLAYASVVDNATQDPTFVPAAHLGE